MEVNSTTFWTILPELMGALVDSRWVAIDVEMTGISTDGHFIPPGTNLQEAYQSVKESAESYQILQIGFTFCKYNKETSEYETKTIECPISPLFPPGMSSAALTRILNRNFTTSVSSYAFLRSHKFPFHRTLDSGVPYLSREEESYARRRVIQMSDGDSIDIPKLSDENIQFYLFYKSKIQRVVERAQSREHICVQVIGQSKQPLNDLETKLICQILQDDFPFLVATEPDGSGRLNIVWEFSPRAPKKRRHNTEAINKLIGIRHVFDALAGGEFASKIQKSWIPTGTPNRHIDPLNVNNGPGFKYAPDMSQVEAMCKATSPIIVGHNLFHDLAFIYQTFFGRLPETLDGFLSTIHKLFPRIIDTKYMFLRAQGQAHHGQAATNRSLSELYSLFSEKQFPFIQSTDNFIEKSKNPHHAGRDSALTMTVFLKQAVYLKGYWSQPLSVPESLRRRRENILDEQKEWEKASKDGLDRYEPLHPDQPASFVHNSLPKLEPPLQDSSTQRLENYSAKEAAVIPLWSEAFWREFGNKTRIGNAGVVEFQ